jgi:hypothetical protein
LLTRELDGGHGTLNFIMLNPSTADAVRDDPTIRRCISFARVWGFRRLVVTNLFAFRTPSPRALRRAAEPIGPENDAYLLRAARDAHRTICAWGTYGAHEDREAEVLTLLKQHPLEHLGLTKHGHPRHPLYVAATAVTSPYVKRAPQLAAA